MENKETIKVDPASTHEGENIEPKQEIMSGIVDSRTEEEKKNEPSTVMTTAETIAVANKSIGCGKCKKPKKDNRERIVPLPEEPGAKMEEIERIGREIGDIIMIGGHAGENDSWAQVSLFDKNVCNCGRPPLYSEELLAKAKEYAALSMPFTGEDGIEELIHTVVGLALYIGIHKETAYQWSKELGREEFSDVLKQVMSKQEKKLVMGGLSEKFSGSITKLMLTKHGYRDSSETLVTEIPVDPEVKKVSDAAIADYLKGK